MKKIITERDIIEAGQNRQTFIIVLPNAIITPAAADAAKVRGITLERKALSADAIPSPESVPKTNRAGKIILGSDHGGFELKELLIKYLIESGEEAEDVGTYSTESVDYPDFAHLVARKVAQDVRARGIIIDGAGVGSAMTANKIPGIRAATCTDVYTARNSRAHNDANILTLGSRVVGVDVAKEIVTVWLGTDFEGGRHAKRVEKIMEVEKKYRQ